MSNRLEQLFQKSSFKKIENNQFFCEEKQMSLKEMLEMIKNHKYFDIFKEEMTSIDLEKIYKSETHGISHNERVAIFIMAICVLEEYTEDEVRIALNGAKYHDIGRVNDYEDDTHGLRSSELLDKINLNLSAEDKEILKCACIGHSIDDEFYDEIITDIKDSKKAVRALQTLKDADALDRVRLEFDGLNPNYLRTKSSKKLIAAAYELYENYYLIKELENEQRNYQRN